jgi:hypothetical protein
MASMNHLVILDAQAGELEKILSGVKNMVINIFDPAGAPAHLVRPGDCLYFLREKDENMVRVTATVVRVSYFINGLDEDLPQALKELQPRLQLTEDQYNYWSGQKQAHLLEFNHAQKIAVFQVAPGKVTSRSDWIAFKTISEIT